MLHKCILLVPYNVLQHDTHMAIYVQLLLIIIKMGREYAKFSFYMSTSTRSIFMMAFTYFQMDFFQSSSPNRVESVGIHSECNARDDPISQIMMGSSVMRLRDVIINQPTYKISFGFVLHSDGKWQGSSIHEKQNTVVWEKFTVGYFHVKIVPNKIFSSLGVFDKNFLTTNYF